MGKRDPLRVCIHRGTHEIGGTCIEIESQGKRIVLDVGLPLDAADPESLPLPPIRGFSRPDPSLLGVVISHPHQDHYGLAPRLPKGTLFLIGSAAANILAAAGLFSPAGLTLTNVRHLEHRTPIQIGPFTLTPYLVDHSAYDAYAVHVQAGGVGLFYTGDLRAHGRKQRLFQELLESPPQNVDLLLMEGTTVGRRETGLNSEGAVEERLVEMFSQTTGMPLVCCSGQNIDRLVSVARAALKANRQLIIDMYTAHVLRATGNERLPQSHWNFIRVFLPKNQKLQIIKKRAFEVAKLYEQDRIYTEQLAAAASHSVMLFRPSMMQELEGAGCLSGARLIYSLWPGYLKRAESKRFLDWLARYGIRLDRCHTSGHASVNDLVALRQRFPKATVVPIHSGHPEKFEELFNKVMFKRDGRCSGVRWRGG